MFIECVVCIGTNIKRYIHIILYNNICYLQRYNRVTIAVKQDEYIYIVYIYNNWQASQQEVNARSCAIDSTRHDTTPFLSICFISHSLEANSENQQQNGNNNNENNKYQIQTAISDKAFKLFSFSFRFFCSRCIYCYRVGQIDYKFRNAATFSMIVICLKRLDLIQACNKFIYYRFDCKTLSISIVNIPSSKNQGIKYIPY